MQINAECFSFEVTSLAGSVAHIDRQAQSLILMPNNIFHKSYNDALELSWRSLVDPDVMKNIFL